MNERVSRSTKSLMHEEAVSIGSLFAHRPTLGAFPAPRVVGLGLCDPDNLAVLRGWQFAKVLGSPGLEWRISDGFRDVFFAHYSSLKIMGDFLP